MKVKKEVEFWDIKNMYQYALEFYSINEEEDDYYGTYKNTTISRITDRMKECKFIPVKTNDSQKKYQLPVEMAKFFIDTMMYDYFMGDATARKEKSRKRAEEVRNKKLKDAETKSLEKDKQLEFDKGVAYIANTLNDESENNPLYDTNGKVKATIDNALWTKKQFHTLTNGERVKKESFGYHLPALTVDEMNEEILNETIDRMMLRTIFDMFFDFDEKSFRHDLYERAADIKEIDRDGIIPEDGFSELTRKLENPLGIYVTPKKSNRTKK